MLHLKKQIKYQGIKIQLVTLQPWFQWFAALQQNNTATFSTPVKKVALQIWSDSAAIIRKLRLLMSSVTLWSRFERFSSLPVKLIKPPDGGFVVLCDSGAIRTRDPQLRRLLLCPTELRNRVAKLTRSYFCDAKIRKKIFRNGSIVTDPVDQSFHFQDLPSVCREGLQKGNLFFPMVMIPLAKSTST